MNNKSTWLKLLSWFCPPGLHEAIEGDLIEQFEIDVKEVGESRARRRFVWHAIKFFRPEIILRNRVSINLNQFGMLTHFFKIFFRTSLKNGTYSLINIAGLAVGLASSIFILLWVIDEITFDHFHEDKQQIYMIMGNHTYPDRTVTFPQTPGPLTPALKDLPEVEEACRTNDQGNRILFTSQDKSIYEEGVFADPSIFKIFTIPLLGGNRLDPLPDNNAVAISEKLASKFFGDEDPIGKVFRLDNKMDVRVTALFNDLPQNSTLQFEFILPYALYAKEDQYNQEWGAWTGGNSYVKLRGGANIEVVNKKIHELFTKPHIWVRWDTNVVLFLFSMNDWRLYDGFNNGKQEGGRVVYVRAFAAVAIFILLIACINFMNLATARSVSRSREVGVRKVIGAGRKSLIGQFIGESILIAAVSLLVGLLIVHLLMPTFNELTGKQLGINYTDPVVYGILVCIILATGLLAGSYPAFLLSSLKVIQVLKGKVSGLSGGGIRKALVVFQFSLSVMLIICALVVYKQINFMRNKNLGFDKENAFYLTVNDDLRRNFEVFKNEALLNPAIKFVARSDYNPMEILGGVVLADNAWPGKTKEDNIAFQFFQCDYNLLPALGFTFIDGRNFSPEFISDSANYIITEEAARRMKLSAPVGQFLNGPTKGHIVGVIKDFHSSGLQKAIQPVIIAMNPNVARRIVIRYESGSLEKAMEHIRTAYQKVSPDFPMEYGFLDEPFGRQYQNEILIGKLATCFTVVAIFISCLGLFGLSSFTAEKRSKEISLRKVLGASVSQIVVLLCKDFMLVIVVALLVGLPIAWWGMNKFLETFQFRTELSISVFAVTGFTLLAIAMLTVSYQSVRAALTDPAKSLKAE